MMKVCVIGASMAALVSAAAPALAAPPAIDSMSRTSGAPNTRVVLRGHHFATRDAAYVEVNGRRAPAASWSDVSISIYIPANLPAGPAALRVVTPDGASEPIPFDITNPLASPRGKDVIAWKFETDGFGVRHRGSVGADGTVYFGDNLGFIYAVEADGDLRWIYCADCEAATGGEGPVVLGHDGTIYSSSDPLGPDEHIHAINPDGTRRWLFSAAWTSLISGPNIGPDGNVYFVHENLGTGLTALRPDTGEVIWSAHPSDRAFLEFGEVGAELVFGPSETGGEINRVYPIFDMRPLQPGIPNGAVGTLFSYSLDGGFQWERYTGGQSIAGGQLQGQAAVGLDGTVYHVSLLPPRAWALYANRPEDGSERWVLYLPPGNTMSEPTVSPRGDVLVVRNTVHIHAVNPTGTVRWTYTDSGAALTKGPAASPNGEIIVAGGSIGDTESFSGHVRAVSADGQALWAAYVPREPDGSGGTNGFIVTTRAFYSPDSARAYVGMSMAGSSATPHAYLVAMDTGVGDAPCTADFNADGAVTSQDFFDFLAAFFGAAPSADINDDGAVTSQDFFDYVAAFFSGC